jgi:hypothetical protein
MSADGGETWAAAAGDGHFGNPTLKRLFDFIIRQTFHVSIVEMNFMRRQSL